MGEEERVKCIASCAVKIDGRMMRFERGAFYPISEVPEDILRAYFEHPEIAPPKKSTRNSSGPASPDKEG